MAKNWNVKQKAMVKGQVVSASFTLPFMEESEVTAFCSLLEGGYEVVEVNASLSNMTKAETNAAASNPVKTISIRGEQNQGAFISAYGNKPIHFKNTVTGDDIRAVFANKKIFEAVPTAGVTYVSIKAGESTIV
jgi:hypothetical protein